MYPYALCTVAFQPDLTMCLDPTSPTIPLVSHDTPTAKSIIGSIKVDVTEESYRGANDVSENMDEEEMNACTKCNGPMY
jgi:hypothetical protein